jgi:hypothetical protein
MITLKNTNAPRTREYLHRSEVWAYRRAAATSASSLPRLAVSLLGLSGEYLLQGLDLGRTSALAPNQQSRDAILASGKSVNA